MTLGWKCKYSWISEFSDQMAPILLQRKICIEMISKTKRNPVISAKAQIAQPLVGCHSKIRRNESSATKMRLWPTIQMHSAEEREFCRIVNYITVGNLIIVVQRERTSSVSSPKDNKQRKPHCLAVHCHWNATSLTVNWLGTMSCWKSSFSTEMISLRLCSLSVHCTDSEPTTPIIASSANQLATVT